MKKRKKERKEMPTDSELSFATFPHCWLELVVRSQHCTEPPGTLCKSVGTLGSPYQPQRGRTA